MRASYQKTHKRQRFNYKPEIIPVRFTRSLFASMKFRLIVGGLILAASIIYPFLRVKNTEAELSSFFPTSCRGGWENVEKAQGAPNVVEGGTEKYSDLNSASLVNTGTQIYCGGFKGEIPQDAVQKKIVLKFSWTTQADSVVNVEPSIDQGPAVIEELPLQEAPTQDEQAVPETPSDNSSMNESSFLHDTIFSQALAQENNDVTQAPVPAGAIFEVRYTFDDIDWRTLGYVNDINNTVSFEIPMDAAASLADLDQAQIALYALPTIDGMPKIYLDAMWLEVEYQGSSVELSQEEINNLPRVRIDNMFKSTEEDFQADEEPKFEVDPNALIDTTEKKIEMPVAPILTPNESSGASENSETNEVIETNPEAAPNTESTSEPNANQGAESAPIEGVLPPTSQLFHRPSSLIAELHTVFSAFSQLWFKKNILTALAQDATEAPVDSAPQVTETPVELPAEPAAPTVVEPGNEVISQPTGPDPMQAPIDGAISSPLDPTVLTFVSTSKIKVIKSDVYDPEGEKATLQPIVEESNGIISISLPKPGNEFIPGKYKMDIEILKGRVVFVSSQDFTWGVLAINVNKSIYLPQEVAYIQMGALDDGGNTLCDASLQLTIKNETTQTENKFATSDGTIEHSKNCGPNNVTDDPDYFIHYQVADAGVYHMFLKRVDSNTGATIYEIADSFEVKDELPFEVERIGATRINPFLSKYKMTFEITVNQDFNGDIIEMVPNSYTISEADDATERKLNGEKFIVWQKSLNAGDTIELQYEYQGAKVSPQAYVLGPLKFAKHQNWLEKLFGVDQELIFEEARQWQIASDSLSATWTGAVNGNWSNGGNWSGGTAPNAGDNLIFPSGASNLSNTNDLPQNTIFNSITLSGSGYTLGGNDIVLGPGLAGITDSVSSGGNTISLNIRLDATRNIWITNSGESLTISGMIGGAGGFNKEGVGKLVLSGANTYAGTTTINAGVVNLRNNTALGTIAAGTAVVGASALELQDGIAVGYEALTLRGFGISEAGALRNISGDNSFAGLITQVAGGTEITADSGTLSLTGGVTGAFPLIIDGAGNTTFDIAPIAIGAGTVTKRGAGTLTYEFPNTYSGTTTIHNGTLLYGIDNAILSGGITMVGGTLDIATYSDMVGTITLGLVGGTASPTITGSTGVLSSATYTVYSGTISAIIAGDGGALTKSSPGTVVLTRPNQFSGAVTVSAGTLDIRDSMSLGVIDGATTVTAGATLLVNGSSLSIPEYITISGTGMLYTGAIRNTGGNNSLTGVVTLGAAAMIEADTGTTLTIDGKGVSAVTFALTIGGAGNVTTTSTAPIWGTTAALVKNDGGTLTLGGYNNFTGTTTVNEGIVVLTGSGTIPSSAVTINSGATLTADNSTTDLLNRLSSSALTMNGGNFNYIGGSSYDSTESAGALTLSSGYNVITITPGSGGQTAMTFASLSRTAGATALFRGTNFGATPAANVSTLIFTSAPALTGAGVTPNTTNIGVIKGAFGDTSLSGNGSDMVTYNIGNTNGLRLLNQVGFSNEYSSSFSANDNVKLTANTTAATQSINSLILNGYDVTDAGAARTITLASASLSGNILINSANNIAGANTTIGITTNELNILASASSTISAVIGTAVAGSMTINGTGNVTLSAAAAYTGTTYVNNATLTLGASNVLSTGGLTVNNGTFDIGANNESVGAVVLRAGTITGGAGTLTSTASYSFQRGTVSAIIGGTVAVTRVATNAAADSVVTVSRDNTYTGATTITSGILRLGGVGGATNTPLGTVGTGTSVATIGALDLNGYTMVGAEPISSLSGLGFGPGASVANGNSNMGALMNSSSTPATYSGTIALGAAARIAADASALTVSGNISGAFVLTIGGFNDSTFSGVLSTITGLTKDGFGTLTLSNSNSYAGVTTVSVGTLKLGANGGGTNTPLGIAGAGNNTSVTAGAMLDLNGYTLGTAELLTLNGMGFGYNVFAPGALTNTSSTAVSYSGLITLGSATTIMANNGDISLTATGTITGSGNGLTIGGTGNGSLASIIGTVAGTLTKIGTGTWTLSGNSTFTGATTIANGTLKLGAAGSGTDTPLGTVAGASTINSGGVLDLNGFTLATAEGLTLNGRGINDGGALVNNSGSGITYSGALTLASDSRITNSGAGLLTLTGTITTAGFTARIGGAGSITHSTGAASGTGGITKDGAGTLTANVSETYTGATTIEAGTFQYGASGLLAVTAVTVNGGTWNAGGITDTVGVITLIDGTITNGTLTGATSYTVEKGTIGAVLAGAVPFVKNRQGTVTMTAANTMSSTATINGGTVVLSGSGSAVSATFTVNLGATLTLDNSTTNVASRLGDALALTLNGANFNFIGSNTAATNAAETTGALSPASGHNTVTVTPGSGGSTTMTFASWSRTAGATVLFRGTNFGSTPGANVSSMVFTSTTGLITGSSLTANTTTISTIKGGFGDTSLSGTGSDMVTYNVGNTNGLRLLNQAGFSGEYAANFGTLNANVKLTGNTAASAQTINSLILNGNSVTNPGTGQTITMGGASLSGNILINSANNIDGANTTIGITTNELPILATAASTISAVIGTATTGSVDISGSGNVTLSGASLYTGTTFVNNATATWGANNAISSGNVTIVGGTVNLNGNSDTIGAVSINAGTIATGAGTLTLGGTVTSIANNNVSSFITGNLGLGANRSFVIADGVVDNDVIVSAVVSGAFNITKDTSAGVLVFSGDNSYTGTTTINAGTLRLGATGGGTNTPLGTTGGATTVSGASSALDLNGYTLGTSEALTLSGALAGGALQNLSSASATYNGLITLGAASTIISNYGDINIANTGTISGATFALTIGGSGNGTLSSILGTTSGTLTKNGVGMWTVSGNNTFTGTTTISAGTFRLGGAGSGSNTPLGTTTNATAITSGAMLDLNGYTLVTAEAITSINGTGINSRGAITNNSSSATGYSGVITLGAASRIVNYGSGELTFSGNIVGSTLALTFVAVGPITQSTASVWSGTSTSLVKEGQGVLTLGGQNSFTTGTVTVSTGTVKLGANGGATNTPLGTNGAGTVVSAGGVLDLSTFALGGASTWEPLTLNGTGINNTGALISGSSGTNTFGVLTLGSNARIINSGSGTITFAGAPTGTFNYVIGGSGPTTFSGIFPAAAITITKYDSGILSLNAANLLTGLVRINGGTLKYGATNTLATGAVTIAGGTLDINGFSDSVGTVTLISGSIINGGGTAALTSTATYAFESGTVSARLDSTAAAGISKTTSGQVILSGDNVLTSSTSIALTVGELNLQHSNALGAAANSLATTVTAGATLELQNTITIPSTKTFTINGTGVGGIGAIRNVSDSNTIQGAITLSSITPRFKSDSGSLTVSGAISGATNSLLVGGAGNTTISGVIGTTSGTLTKDGTGTLTLTTATNTYTGLTTVSAGVLNIQNAASLGTTAAGTVVNSGGALEIQGTITVGAEALTLYGDGVSSNGALRNITDNNTYQGTITLGSNASIGSDSGTLTLSGTITGASSIGLTKVGAGTVAPSNTVSVGGNFAISAGTLTASSNTITVSGNWTNSGTFTAGSSTVTLNGTSTQTLSGTMTGGSAFNNLTITNASGTSASDCERTGFVPSVDFAAAASASTVTFTTANTRVEYNSGSTYTFTNISWNGQAVGTPLYFRNSAVTGTWLLNVSGTQGVSYVNVSRSDASAGNAIVADNGTNTNCGNNSNWNFNQFLTFSLSDSAVSFGDLSILSPRYATTGTGSNIESTAHTISVDTNANYGYTLYVQGDPVTQVSSNHVITSIGATPTASNPGTEQFGIRATISGGSGSVSSPYNHASNYGYNGTSTTQSVIGSASGSSNDLYTIRYLCNIGFDTDAGAYATNLTYTAVGSF